MMMLVNGSTESNKENEAVTNAPTEDDNEEIEESGTWCG